MKPYQVDGYDDEAAANISHVHLISSPPPDVCLRRRGGGSLKDVVPRRKPPKLEMLRKEIET
jgi:hypothetical protein